MSAIFLRQTFAGPKTVLQRFPRPRIGVRKLASSSTSPKPGGFGTFTTFSLVTAVSLTAYGLGSLYPPTPISLLYPRPAPPPPTDPTSPESLAYSAALEKKLQALPALQTLRAGPDADEWYETRPHANLPPAAKANTLTAGALRGPGKLAVPPLARVKRDESAAHIFVHLGRGLCGHDGIVHGGLLATLLDEALARNAFMNLPEKVGVTATMTLNYRAPTRADQFVVLKTQLVEVKGRKAVISGRVEDLDGTLLVDAQALFIQPRYAKQLNSPQLWQQIGEPATKRDVSVVVDAGGK
ncbi:HotDog domain-containing protein [Mycena crocata]|nr:HotDog domain-containing protein [Mycena crocata]